MKKEAKLGLTARKTYQCFHPRMGILAHDYVNKRLDAEEKSLFEAHLLLCLECQEIVLEWEEIFQRAARRQRESTAASELRVMEVGRS